MKEIEISNKTVEDALNEVKHKWNLNEGEYEYEVVDPGSKGFLKIGSRDAQIKVKLTSKYFSRMVAEYVKQILDFSKDTSSDLQIQTEESDSKIFVYLKGNNLGRMIGKHGKTISALQHLANIYVNRVTESKVNVFIEVGDYKDRRREIIKKIARQYAYKVIKTGKKIELDPMFAFERRIIHETVKSISGVKSFSMGLEPYRYVVIEPVKRPQKYNRKPGEQAAKKRGGRVNKNGYQSEKLS